MVVKIRECMVTDVLRRFVKDLGRVLGHQSGVGGWRKSSATGQGALSRRVLNAGREPRRIAPCASGMSRYSSRPILPK